jgi:hypothetical protein
MAATLTVPLFVLRQWEDLCPFAKASCTHACVSACMKSEKSLDTAQWQEGKWSSRQRWFSASLSCCWRQLQQMLKPRSLCARPRPRLRLDTFLSICKVRKTSAHNETPNPFLLSGPLTPVYTTIQKFRWRFWRKPAEEKEEKFDALPIIAARHTHQYHQYELPSELLYCSICNTQPHNHTHTHTHKHLHTSPQHTLTRTHNSAHALTRNFLLLSRLSLVCLLSGPGSFSRTRRLKKTSLPKPPCASESAMLKCANVLGCYITGNRGRIGISGAVHNRDYL